MPLRAQRKGSHGGMGGASTEGYHAEGQDPPAGATLDKGDCAIRLAFWSYGNYNKGMSAKNTIALMVVFFGVVCFGGPRSFVWAQQTVTPSAPNLVATQVLDQMAAESTEASAAGMTGKIMGASGTVKIRHIKTLLWETAAIGQEVTEGDHIKTGRDGQVKIAFADGNTLYIKKDSVVIVETLARDAKTQKYDAVFRVTKARLKAQIDDKQGLNNFEIRTPVVVCGVRGTILYVNARPGFAEVFVERGSAFLRNVASGREMEIPQGLATTSDKSGNIAEPETPAPEQLAEMQEGWEPLLPPPPPPGETQSLPPPPEGRLLPPPIILADVLPPPDQQKDALLDRSLTQETTKTDYINNPPPPASGGIDSDGDGLTDNVDPDDDNDYLKDVDEIAHGTNALLKDSDNDGLTDWEELRIQGTNPLLANTDGANQNDLNDLDSYDPAISPVEDRTTIRDTRYNQIAVIAGLRAEISSMLGDAAERQKDYIMDRISDAQTHKVMKDSAGMWVRLEQYVFRPTPNKVMVSALTYHTSSQLTMLTCAATFKNPLTGLTSQQLKNLPWETYMADPYPVYGAIQSNYPIEMTATFERRGVAEKLIERRMFSDLYPSSPPYYYQDVSKDVSINGGTSWWVPNNFVSFIGNPASYQYDVGLGPTTISASVHVINDNGVHVDPSGNAVPYNYSFNGFWQVLGCNLSTSFPDIGSNTIELILTFNGHSWSYLFVPIDNMLWRGTPQWEEQLTW